MRTFLILFWKELRSFFLSPVAYVVLALIMVLSGFIFKHAIDALSRAPQAESLVVYMFGSNGFLLFFFPIFPLITMRLFAEEQKLGTIEGLLTAPVRASQVVISKYLAALTFYCVLWVPTFLYFSVFQWVTGDAAVIPGGQLLGSALILFLTGAFYVSIGCFASSLTSNQIIAGILCFTLTLMHFLLGVFVLYQANNVAAQLTEALQYFAVYEHFKRFTSGLIDTRPIVYYLTLSAFFIALTHKVMEYRRWKV